MFLVLVNEENILKELVLVTADRSKAEAQFLATCADNDFDIVEDKERFLDEGYASWGGGAVMLIDTDGHTSDNEIAAEIGGFPPKVANKITRWLASGHIGEVGTIDEVLEKAGRMLDKSGATDLFGTVIFEVEGGLVYAMNCEGVIGFVDPTFLADIEEEAKYGNS